LKNALGGLTAFDQPLREAPSTNREPRQEA
jgi:hypothetical protein